MRYPAIVFDLDGTLLNTIDDLRDCTNYALTAHGFPPKTTEEMKAIVGRGIRYMVSHAMPDGESNPAFEEVFSTFRAYYDVHCADQTAPYAGIPELLGRLKAAGCKTAVVTNKVQSAAQELVNTMFPDIAVVVGDSPAVKRKPEPDGVWYALKQLGVERQDAAYVGDSDIDYATAQNSGLPCLSVLWGFRTREQLLQCGATNFFETPEALGDYILG
jgi:phosphoglycolate phosphatase